jgi:hypothetical protein
VRIALALLILFAACDARADGGTLRVQREAGPLRISVFSAPEPLRAGAADLSVLVQRSSDGGAVLDAEVELQLVGPASAKPFAVRATRGAATNALLYAAPVELGAAGVWSLRVSVQHQREQIALAAELPVSPPPPRLLALWPYLALPPVAVALFALREWLVRRRRSD